MSDKTAGHDEPVRTENQRQQPICGATTKEDEGTFVCSKPRHHTQHVGSCAEAPHVTLGWRDAVKPESQPQQDAPIVCKWCSKPLIKEGSRYIDSTYVGAMGGTCTANPNGCLHEPGLSRDQLETALRQAREALDRAMNTIYCISRSLNPDNNPVIEQIVCLALAATQPVKETE